MNSDSGPKQVCSDGKSVVQTAADLGLPTNMLHRWRREAKPTGRVFPGHGLLHHSDQGSQYTANGFRRQLRQRKMVESNSRKGDVWDNAAMEAFFSSLEMELLQQKHFKTKAEAIQEIFIYICHEAKLAIELDGSQYDEPAQKAHDEVRTQALETGAYKCCASGTKMCC